LLVLRARKHAPDLLAEAFLALGQHPSEVVQLRFRQRISIRRGGRFHLSPRAGIVALGRQPRERIRHAPQAVGAHAVRLGAGHVLLGRLLELHEMILPMHQDRALLCGVEFS